MVYGSGLGGTYGVTDARFNMSALLLHQNDPYQPLGPEGDINLDQYGEWVDSQDPLTGEIVRVWKPFVEPLDDPTTPEDESAIKIGTVPCIARGIVDGGIRVAGSTERFGDTYENIDWVKLWLPPHVKISKRDRVTNIRDVRGHIRWVDEELTDPRTTEVPKATVFNVNGVTPLFDAFNDVVEQFVLLEKAETYERGEFDG